MIQRLAVPVLVLFVATVGQPEEPQRPGGPGGPPGFGGGIAIFQALDIDHDNALAAREIPVRTLTVLYRAREARFLAELRQWYRADRVRAMAEGTEILGSVSSATRAPGRYSFKWDMKDQGGKVVKPGPYTVCIEAAREHGTYQLMRQPIDTAGAPRQVQVPINGVEITAATIDYHKTTGK